MIKVIKFWAEWCGPCRVYAPKFQAAMEATGVLHEEINTDEDMQSASIFGVSALPTTLILCGDQVVTRLVGVVEPDELEDAIEGAIDACSR